MRLVTTSLALMAMLLLAAFVTGCGSEDHSGHDQKQHQH